MPVLPSVEDGGSHQAIEDLSLMRSLPNMTVINPADAKEAQEALKAAVDYEGPVYIRLGRAEVPDIHDDSYQSSGGKAKCCVKAVMSHHCDRHHDSQGTGAADALKARASGPVIEHPYAETLG